MHLNKIMEEESSPAQQNYLSIEGNIGCGKSTFLQVLKERIPELHWIEEPVKEWQQLSNCGVNMLDRYYKEPHRWGFTFQTYAIFTRLKKMQEACERFPNKLKISERSILADKYVFSQIMRELDYMDEAEYEVFKSLYSSFEKQASIIEPKIIYLRCKPEICFERTKTRKRPEEKEIPVEYLQMIHGKHEKWFEHYDASKVLIIDTTEDFRNDESKINQIIEKLKKFIQK